jgi:NAD(P)-dependent dehydrogenase (short-subunit alcohol dehydrogenase family)
MSPREGAFIVTGASSGIGQAIAYKLCGLGHSVFGLGRDPEKLERVAIRMPHGKFTRHAADLADPKATHQAVVSARAWLESSRLPLFGLVNCAGVFDRIPFHLTSDTIWERHFHNNLMSAVRLTRELYPDLKRGSPSSVLNISSTLGTRPVAETSAYSALKAAMNNWTQTLALEWAPDGIRANVLSPGLVDTPIHGFHRAAADDPDRARAEAAQPLGRMGRPEDIAETAVFLLSPSSSWTTGSIVTVDGGISL